ncbi:protein kinase [Myxococcota bacterium]|nr:protein kinase [Myxococcota bacterium]
MTYYEDDASSEARAIHPGDLLGSYRVIARKGGGAHGTVYQVEHVILGKRFALKQLQASVAQSENIEQRFLREARLLAMLEHPNIVQIVDCQRDPQYGLFLVLEWLHGCTLEDALKRGRLTGREVRVIFRQLCWALELAQSYGIVHRDIKPANIFLQKHFNAFRIKLMDFGVSTASGGGTGELTMAGQMLGSAPYMPPEQVRGDIASIDGRSDIYSCGILLAETLTGKPPFTGPMPSLLFKHLQDPPPPLRQLAPDIRWNDNLEAIYQKALAKTNDQRFSTPLEFWFALREALVGSALGQGTIEDGVVMRTLNDIFQKTDDAQAKRQLHASYFWGDNEISDEPSEHVSPSSADLISVAAAFQPKEDRTGGDLAALSSQDDLPTHGTPLALKQHTTSTTAHDQDHLTPPPPPPLPPHLLSQHISSGSSSFVPLPDPSDSFPQPSAQHTSSSFAPLQDPQHTSSSFAPLQDPQHTSSSFAPLQDPQRNAPFPQQPVAQRNPAAFARASQPSPSSLSSAPQTPQQGNAPFYNAHPPTTPAPTPHAAAFHPSAASFQETVPHYVGATPPHEQRTQASAPLHNPPAPPNPQAAKRSSYSSAQDRPAPAPAPSPTRSAPSSQNDGYNVPQARTGTHNIPPSPQAQTDTLHRPHTGEFRPPHHSPQHAQRTTTPPQIQTYPPQAPTAYTYPPQSLTASSTSHQTGSHPPLPTYAPAHHTGSYPPASASPQAHHTGSYPPASASPQAHHTGSYPPASASHTGSYPPASASPQAHHTGSYPPASASIRPAAAQPPPNPFAFPSAPQSNPYAESDALLADLVDESDYYDDNEDEGDATMLAPQGAEMLPPPPPRPTPPSAYSPKPAAPPFSSPSAQPRPRETTSSPAIKPPPPPPPPPPSSAISRVGAQDKKKP